MEWSVDNWELFLACILFALFAGLLCDMALRWYLKGAEGLHMTAGIGMAVAAIYMGIYGFSLDALRCTLLCYFLVLAGAADIATHEIPDAFHLLVAMAGLIGFKPVPALLGFLLVPAPFLVAALKTGKVGGGDVKLMAASGFALGVLGGFWMMSWGLLMALLWNLAMRQGKDKLPLAPFLAYGCFMVLLPVS